MRPPRNPEIFAGAAVAAALFLTSGCAGDTDPSTPSPTETVVVAAPEIQTDRPEMQRTFQETTDADPQVTIIQKAIIDASTAVAQTGSYQFSMNGGPVEVRLSVPEDPDAREQVIVITGDSADAGSIFSQLELANYSEEKTSVTLYSLSPDDQGRLVRVGGSISVVGQETQGAGLFRNAATEACQPLEISTDSELISKVPDAHDAAMEAICNALGFAVDSIMLNDSSYETYLSYLDEYTASQLGADVNSGYELGYPVLTQEQFKVLADQLSAVKY